MTTAQLIEQLKRADPEGNLVVNIDGALPFCVQTLPAYYDGDLFDLERDEELNCYNVKGAIFRRSGLKVEILTMDLRSVLIEQIDLPVKYEGFTEEAKVRKEKRINDLREEITKELICLKS